MSVDPRNAVGWLALFFVLILDNSVVLAYEANVGARAANFRAFDIVSRQPIELDDYLGQWVLIEHWATWCGASAADLPRMLRATQPYVDAGQLAVITVCNDVLNEHAGSGQTTRSGSDTGVGRIQRAIAEHGLPYPVVFDGGVHDLTGAGWSLPAIEWGVTHLPSSFLINESGVVVISDSRGDALQGVLDFFLNHSRPLMGIRGSHGLNVDGSIWILAEVMNSGHEPVQVFLDYHWENWTYSETDPNKRITNALRFDETGYDSSWVRFDRFSEAVHEFTIPLTDRTQLVGYSLRAIVPNSTGFGSSDDGSIELTYWKHVAVLKDLKEASGEWHFDEGAIEVYP